MALDHVGVRARSRRMHPTWRGSQAHALKLYYKGLEFMCAHMLG